MYCMRLFEDPDEPLVTFKGIKKPALYNDDAVTWIIRKPNLYILSLTTYNTHSDVYEIMLRWISGKYSESRIREDAENNDINIVGHYDDYSDFITNPTDSRKMGLLTGRYWYTHNVISSWDTDNVFISQLPQVIKMLKESF
jgi:hypothetical protein